MFTKSEPRNDLALMSPMNFDHAFKPCEDVPELPELPGVVAGTCLDLRLFLAETRNYEIFNVKNTMELIRILCNDPNRTYVRGRLRYNPKHMHADVIESLHGLSMIVSPFCVIHGMY